MSRMMVTQEVGYSRFNKTVTVVPERNGETAFDSTLDRSHDNSKNHVLTLHLRIFFSKIEPWDVTDPVFRHLATSLGVPVPATGSVGTYRDADDTPNFIKSWTPSDWSRFENEFKRQGLLWDSKFWLIPPDNFTHLDIVEGSWTAPSGAVTTRPNVKCRFKLDIAPMATLGHRRIEVVNLLIPSGSFRSHDRLYDSGDATTRATSRTTNTGVVYNTTQPVIAHEIGHALGLPHIGVTRSIPACVAAVSLEGFPYQDAVPAIYKGGSNGSVCYGAHSTAGDLENIMGIGKTFNVENAEPWLARMPHHFNLPIAQHATMMANFGRWKVSLTEVAPRPVPTATAGS